MMSSFCRMLLLWLMIILWCTLLSTCEAIHIDIVRKSSFKLNGLRITEKNLHEHLDESERLFIFGGRDPKENVKLVHVFHTSRLKRSADEKVIHIQIDGDENKLPMDSVKDEPPAKRQRLNRKIVDISESVFPPPEEKSPLNILNSLNDHCLQEIFKKISIVDLSSVVEVCTRFKRNAEQIFSLCHEKRFHCVSLTLLKPQVFNNFVHLLKTVYLNGLRSNYCLDNFNGDSMIQSLHLRSANVHVDKLRPLFPRLKCLEISSCSFVGETSDLFSSCSELEYLKVKLSEFDQFLPCKMPKLKKFEFDDYVYSESLLSFVEMNPQLSSITITTINTVQAPKNFNKHLAQFGNLQSLKVLKIPCFQFSVTSLIQSLCNNKIPIEQLELQNCRIDDASFNDIFQMKSIKILTITGIESLTSDRFVGLAKELPKLEVIRLETPYRHDSKVTLDDIKHFVEQSKNLYLLTIGNINRMTINQSSYNYLLNLMEKSKRKTLNITIIYENNMNILVPKQTLKKNKEKIRIVKMKCDPYVYDSGSGSDDSSSSDDDDDGSDSDESDESSDFASIIGSDDGSDDNSDDNWLDDVYNK